MKKNKNIFVLLLLAIILVASYSSTFLYVKLNNKHSNEDKFLVMTSCNPIYIATQNAVDGIDGIAVENLSQPTTGCLHDYTLTAQDMKNLSRADVLIVNGGGMEGYLDDVIAAYPNLPIIDVMGSMNFVGAGNDMDVLNELLEENSHVWMSKLIHEIETGTIASALAMNENFAQYEQQLVDNSRSYGEKLESELSPLADSLRATLAGENVVLLHEAYEYVAFDFDMDVVGVMDLDEERQVSASEVSELLSTIIDKDVHYVFAERDYGQQIGDMIEEQTDAKVIYLETLIHGSYDANDYIRIMKKNYQLILDAIEN